jgi:formamidopyrimidine-DNA glycosylase
MPELPEVETAVKDLKIKVLGRTFIDIWTDCQKIIKKPPFHRFKKEIKRKKIINIRRRAKNLIFDLSDGKSLLVHQKMTGHLLFGKWSEKNGVWKSAIKGPLSDDFRNGFLHVIFFLDNKFQLALSDMRKFAKIELWDSEKLEKSEYFFSLGPEPFGRLFNFKIFKNRLPKKGKIKTVLMDQKNIAGIGNIYSDEILWRAKIHPLKEISFLSEKELKEIYKAIKSVLSASIKLKGDSFSDYRLIDGKKGKYQNVQKVYGREKLLCKRNDGGIIKRLKIGGRSAHFCPVCQK